MSTVAKVKPQQNVTKIGSTAGRCTECCAYRYCSYKNESGILCDKCIAIFRNQNILNVITSPKPSEQLTKKTIKRSQPVRNSKSVKKSTSKIKQTIPIKEASKIILKTLSRYPQGLNLKEISDRIAVKKGTIFRSLRILIESSQVVFDDNRTNKRVYFHQEYKQNTESNILLALLEKHPYGLRFPEIVAASNINKRIVERLLKKLVEASKILCDEIRHQNKIYFHPNHQNNIEAFQGMRITRASDTEIIKKAIDSFPDICVAQKLVHIAKKSRICVFRNLKLLAAKQEIFSYQDPIFKTTYFASKTNSEAIKRFKELTTNSEPIKVLNFLQEKPRLKTEIMKHLGKSCSVGITTVLRFLEQEGKITSFQVKHLTYYQIK